MSENLKEFEKWWKANTDQWGYMHEVNQTYVARDGWKAALNWILNNCLYVEEDGHQCISVGMIDEELDGEAQ